MPARRSATPRYFPSAAEWRSWLAANHASEAEIVVGYHKVGTGKPSLTWPESVDEALCYGWIDGVRRRVDDARYCIRFSPRRTTSIWSAVNIRRFGELTAEGRVQVAGRKAFAHRKENRSGIYAYEQRKDTFDEPYLSRFRKARRAFAFFEAQPPGYRKLTIWWVVSAKREATREKRLAQLIECSAAARRLPGLERPSPAAKKAK
jgi:uncharacterized protein YdeI (YjbR/CyaY-like superfamily)